MKLAVYITGIIQHRTKVLPYLKMQFEYLQSVGIDVDIYCVFWSPANRYPYKIENVIPCPEIPMESYDSIEYALDILKPKDFKVISYNDLTPGFIEYSNNVNDELYKNFENIYQYQTFTNKTITPEYFISDDSETTVKLFEDWYNYHNSFCKFSHHTSQIYSTNTALTMIHDADVVLKWRYDLLFNWHKYTEKLKLLVELSNKNKELFLISRAWKEQTPIKILRYDNPEPGSIIADDQWFLCSFSAAKNIENKFYKNFITAFSNSNTKGVLQHRLFYESLYNSTGITVETAGPIDELLIRNPESIPTNFSKNTEMYVNEIIEENKRKAPKSQYLIDLYKDNYYGAELQKLITISEFKFR